MTSHKLSSLTGKASVLTVLMVAGILFAAPSAMAQQTAATTTTPPLTPEEQQQQDRLRDTIAVTTRNLEQGEKEVNGVVFTPRWSNPVWVGADSLAVLFVYCLPGEFADSGQQILGGSELSVLESYALALTGDFMVWFMVVENENEDVRLPAAVGVICASDLAEGETRVLSSEEQQEVNNIIQQFITIQNTQITSINQVINVINNVTTNGTGPVTPPPPANDTGGGGGPRFPDRGEVFPFDNATITTDDGGGETTPPPPPPGGGTVAPEEEPGTVAPEEEPAAPPGGQQP